MIRGFFVPEIRAIPNPVGARLAREGVITGSRSFAGKPRSYRVGGVQGFWVLGKKIASTPNKGRNEQRKYTYSMP
ncbi:hypothetical protein EYC95_05755 [Pseudomonas sp. BGI-2]|nr:hypothetical protein EYC95_05755 [Pseudomonas sp. BGI-2]